MITERDNATWIQALEAGGQQREQALEDLQAILARQLPYGISKWLPASDPKFADLVDDSVQITLIRIVEKYKTFEGRSKFTSWAFKIAINAALNELRHRRWTEQSLEGLDRPEDEGQALINVLEDEASNPELSAQKSEVIEYLKRLISEELSSRQQRALRAVIFEGLPMDVVATRMKTNRNALYKLMHDGRVKLRQRAEADGYSPQSLLELFGAD